MEALLKIIICCHPKVGVSHEHSNNAALLGRHLTADSPVRAPASFEVHLSTHSQTVLSAGLF